MEFVDGCVGFLAGFLGGATTCLFLPTSCGAQPPALAAIDSWAVSTAAPPGGDVGWVWGVWWGWEVGVLNLWGLWRLVVDCGGRIVGGL